jgi:hypothetical protein
MIVEDRNLIACLRPLMVGAGGRYERECGGGDFSDSVQWVFGGELVGDGYNNNHRYHKNKEPQR